MNRVNTCGGATGQRGFTLFELVIVVVIVGVLASIAIPTYRQHITKNNRTAAEGFMLQAANKEEQIMLDMRSYVGPVANNAAFATAPPNGLSLNVPANVAQNYNLSIALVAGPPPGFTITATPINPPQNDPQCGKLTLDQTGNKTALLGTAATCW